MDILSFWHGIELVTHLHQSVHKSIMLRKIRQYSINIGFGICDDTTNDIAQVKLHFYHVKDLRLRNRNWVKRYWSMVVARVSSRLVHLDHETESSTRLNSINLHHIFVKTAAATRFTATTFATRFSLH